MKPFHEVEFSEFRPGGVVPPKLSICDNKLQKINKNKSVAKTTSIFHIFIHWLQLSFPLAIISDQLFKFIYFTFL